MTELRGLDLYLDCFAGAAGDMLLGALLDLGVPEGVVKEAIGGLGIPALELTHEAVSRGSLVGRKVHVRVAGQLITEEHGPAKHHHDHHHDHAHHPHEHRAYAEIRVLVAARCRPEVARIALAIFDRLAAAEARRHGVDPQQVMFHELGAADSIADIVGTAAALAWLSPRSMRCRPIPLGGGTVATAHGRLPVPAPATLELLTGCPVEAGGECELTTPTGAAVIVAALTDYAASGAPSAERFGPMPPGRVVATGWGAGTRELHDRPNLLRLVAIERRVEVSDEVELLEANIDDMSGELAGPLVEALLGAGALDAWLAPITMKKGRPALLVSALVEPARRAGVEACFFRESTTIGVRRSARARTVLARKLVEVTTPLGPIAVKLAGRADASGELVEVTNAAPELEACRRVAEARGLPLRRVLEVAAAAAHDLVKS